MDFGASNPTIWGLGPGGLSSFQGLEVRVWGVGAQGLGFRV